MLPLMVHGQPLPGQASRLVEAARADAAKRAGVPAEKIELVSAQAVTWPDGSLGCPRPGVLYTQALVPGWRIRLKAGALEWDYHASERGSMVQCPPERSRDPLAS